MELTMVPFLTRDRSVSVATRIRPSEDLARLLGSLSGNETPSELTGKKKEIHFVHQLIHQAELTSIQENLIHFHSKN